VDTLGGRLLLLVVPVRALLVVTVKGHSRSVSHLLTLGMILDNFPVLLNRNIDVTELDLSLLLLFNLSELLPLERQNETIAASRVDVGDNPDVLDIGGHDLLECLQGELLFISPHAGGFLSLFSDLCDRFGKEHNITFIITIGGKDILDSLVLCEVTMLDKVAGFLIETDKSDGGCNDLASGVGDTSQERSGSKI